MRRGRVKSLRARAAVDEAERMGKPALCWLKRSGWERGGAVVQPYFTPRLVMRGRRDSGSIHIRLQKQRRRMDR